VFVLSGAYVLLPSTCLVLLCCVVYFCVMLSSCYLVFVFCLAFGLGLVPTNKTGRKRKGQPCNFDPSAVKDPDDLVFVLVLPLSSWCRVFFIRLAMVLSCLVFALSCVCLVLCFLVMTLSRLVIVLVLPCSVLPCQDLAVSQLENEYWAMDKVAAMGQDKTN
jgi:hypothetical protein